MKSKKWLAMLLASLMIVPVAIAGCNNNDGKDEDKDEDKLETPGDDEQTPGDDEQTPGDDTPAQDTSTKLNGKIYLVGDSTVCAFSDNYYIPRYGYGTQLYNYINCDKNQIVNLALSGRSSKSFLTESNYSTLTNSITAGDYLIIGFGHNDEKSDEPARFTDPNGSYTEATTAKGDSFQYVLYENYIKLAKDNGATPILCTPITRYDDKGTYTGSVVHVTDRGDYPASIIALGEATQTTVVDLTTITKNIYKADNDSAKYYHAYTSYKEATHTPLTGTETPDGLDKTHINMYGAKMVSYELTQALLKTDCTLKANIKTNSVAPKKDTDYDASINSSYVKPAVEAFDPSKYASRKLSGDWYRTVMGNIGGKKASEFKVSHSNGVFTVGNGGKNNGKFDSSGDGFAAAFMQIDVSKNFTVSASVKVNVVGTDKPNQSGFGLMLRDDIYLDGIPAETYTGKETITSNYVTAGVFGDGTSALFSRVNGTLTKTGNSTTVAVDSTYTVSIERIGQTVNVVFNDGTHNYTKTYTDFDFVAADNNYMYLCMFANRGFEVEFSDVQFAITGDAQGA